MQTRMTALILASENGHAACVRLLLEFEVNKEAIDNVCFVIVSCLASALLGFGVS
jgi:hypothetical protein